AARAAILALAHAGRVRVGIPAQRLLRAGHQIRLPMARVRGCARAAPLRGPASLTPAMNSVGAPLLIPLPGRDRPGVTSRLFTILARHPLTVTDIEQVVIRGRLVLGVLLSCEGKPDLNSIHEDVSALAEDLALEAEITMGPGDPIGDSSGQANAVAGGPGQSAGAGRRGTGRPARMHVTALGSPLTAGAIRATAGQAAPSGANMDRIGRVARRPVTCIEMDVSGGDPVVLRAELARAGTAHEVDVAVQRGGLHRRAMRLIVMD